MATTVSKLDCRAIESQRKGKHYADALEPPAQSNPETNKFFEDFGVWKEAPVLIGSTKYEPLPDVKNIMITGGAGFM